jgi:hypothetical protein
MEIWRCRGEEKCCSRGNVKAWSSGALKVRYRRGDVEAWRSGDMKL